MGVDWLPYEFKWKPGDVKRAPALGGAASTAARLADVVRRARHLSAKSLVVRLAVVPPLRENVPDVTTLLGRNPFPE